MAGIERENEVSAQAHVSAANVKPRSGGRSQNYQNEDGSIAVPAVLRPWIGGVEKISAG